MEKAVPPHHELTGSYVETSSQPPNVPLCPILLGIQEAVCISGSRPNNLSFVFPQLLTPSTKQQDHFNIIHDMLLQIVFVALSAALVPVSAHFKLNYPAVRGDNEDDLVKGPCGGFDTPSSDRTPVSTSSLAVDLEMGHDQSAIQVLLGLGNNPGNNFNITLLPTFRQEVLGEFCLPEIPIPSGLGIMDGMNATLQVVTNGDPTGGLYNVSVLQHILSILMLTEFSLPSAQTLPFRPGR